MKTIQQSPNFSDFIQIEWKSIELIEDFISNQFMLPSKICHDNEYPSLDENGHPQSLTQFID